MIFKLWQDSCTDDKHPLFLHDEYIEDGLGLGYLRLCKECSVEDEAEVYHPLTDEEVKDREFNRALQEDGIIRSEDFH